MDVSVIIPTFSWNSACKEVYRQLENGDELILVCDAESDPLFDQQTPKDVNVLLAGEPESCSGKCNALAYGLESASKEHVVCTDADFSHPAGWLNDVKNSLEENIFVTTLNFFKSEKLPGKLLEPGYLTGIFIGTYSGLGAWGGLMAFNTDEAPMNQIIDQLRRTISDDILISQFFPDKTVNPSNFGIVEIEGGLKNVIEMSKRFGRSMFLVDPKLLCIPVLSVLAYILLLLHSPVSGVLLPILIASLLYTRFGLKRLTFLLAPASLIIISLLVFYGSFSKKIEWNGRTYLWKDRFQVEVLD